MKAISGELDRVSQTLAWSIRDLAERCETTLPSLEDKLAYLVDRLGAHLAKMGVVV
jgi:type I restriction enzyme M protein